MSDCRKQLTDSAFLFKDLDTDKLVVLCGDCAMEAELFMQHRLLLIAL